jgi:formylglycine-generating enzyme required for sulfatase activity
MGSLAGDEEAYDDERPQHSVVLPDYWISRYPLTNAQFRHFVEGDGYQNMEYWTPEGWAWRQGAEPDFTPVEKLGDRDFLKRYKDWIAARQDRSRPHWWDEPRWGSANRPVVGVTWYEALAYCAWLEPRLRAAPPGLGIDPHLQEALEHGKLRLPSEAEWEKAGRGRDGRQWPWGNRWRENAGNVNESKLSETSPVGMFPGGASPYGLLDMAGNVWEWTSSRWGMDLGKPEYGYPYQQRDGREALDGAHARVVRGGSWATNHWYARCASRLRYFPAFFDDDVGFRMVLSLARSET